MLGQAYCFVPVAIETLGAFGPKYERTRQEDHGGDER